MTGPWKVMTSREASKSRTSRTAKPLTKTLFELEREFSNRRILQSKKLQYDACEVVDQIADKIWDGNWHTNNNYIRFCYKKASFKRCCWLLDCAFDNSYSLTGMSICRSDQSSAPILCRRLKWLWKLRYKKLAKGTKTIIESKQFLIEQAQWHKCGFRLRVSFQTSP